MGQMLGVNIRLFGTNPGVLISDNDYKTWQGSLNIQQNKVRGRNQNKFKVWCYEAK